MRRIDAGFFCSEKMIGLHHGSWHFCIDSDQLPAGRITEVAAGEKLVCLLRKPEGLFAFAANCPHAGGRLCEGWLDPQGRVVCALHKYRFNPSNGYNTSGEGYKLKTYPVKEEEGRIFVQF
jgi:3-phenylpropionate/trans-cinnamate dioxygenase ferredoxin subunit